jgi:F-type H+/Na+-transporting ATPase subunit alpha
MKKLKKLNKLSKKLMNIMKIYKFILDNYGYVASIKDGIVICKGLRKVQFGELVIINNDSSSVGIIFTLKSTEVDIVMFGDDKILQIGDIVSRLYDEINLKLGKAPNVKVGYEVLGKHINPFGHLFNDYDLSQKDLFIYNEVNFKEKVIFNKAPGIIEREGVYKPMYTGMQLVDAFFPIGCGQRELLIGDKFTGKTTLAITTIVNQRDKSSNFYFHRNEENNKIEDKFDNDNIYIKPFQLFCIYSGIAQRRTSLLRIYNLLKKENCMSYTCMVTTTSSCKASLQYLTPYSATAIGEYFMELGHDVFITYDDLTNHAVAYRQVSLLLRRPPGREAYPGDVFYVHSSLLERSSQMSKSHGGGSISSFPIIETQCGDVSSYIPTNVISITDGQIFLDVRLFNKGQRPAVNIGLSVSRVGSSAQNPIIKDVSNIMKNQYRDYNNYFGDIGTGFEVDDNVMGLFKQGKRLENLFVQRTFRNYREQFIYGYISSSLFTNNVEAIHIKLYFNLFLNTFFYNKYIHSLRTFEFFFNIIDLAYYIVHSSSYLFSFFCKVYTLKQLKQNETFRELDTIFSTYASFFFRHLQPRLDRLFN